MQLFFLLPCHYITKSGVHWGFWIYQFTFSSNFGNFDQYFIKYLLCHPSFHRLQLHMLYMLHLLDCLRLFHHFLVPCSYLFFWLFSVCVSFWMVSIACQQIQCWEYSMSLNSLLNYNGCLKNKPFIMSWEFTLNNYFSVCIFACQNNCWHVYRHIFEWL